MLPGDETVADDIAQLAGAPLRGNDFVLEGGALDHDGWHGADDARSGCSIPTATAGPRPRPRRRCAALGAKQVIWLGEGLATTIPTATSTTSPASSRRASSRARRRPARTIPTPRSL